MGSRDTYNQIVNCQFLLDKFDISLPQAMTEYVGVIKAEDDFLDVIQTNLADCLDVNSVHFICRRNGENLEKPVW